jgi:O-antigen/teichoic acid export membrane protein
MISTFLKKYSHVNWALADQAMVSGVNFLTGILFARYLGLEEYGRFTLAWMAILFCNSFQQAGIIAPMMSIGPKQAPEDEPTYYGAVFVQQLIWSLGCFFLLWAGVWISGFVKPDWHIQNLALPLAITLLAWQLQDFLRRYFFVRGQGGMAFLNDAVSYLGQISLLIILFRLTDLNTVRVLWLIAGTSSLAVLVGVFKLGALSLSQRMVTKVTRKHWKFSKWMLASALMQWFSGNFYFVAAGAILGPVAVGGIKAAQNIIGVTHILFQAMENFAPAEASKAFTRGCVKSLVSYLHRLTLLGISATGSITLIAWCFPAFLLTLLYGPEFVEYAVVLRWFCILYLFTFLLMPLSVGLRAIEKTRPLFTSLFYVGILSLVSAYPLVKWFGSHGVMLGLLLTKIGMVIVLFVALRFHISDLQKYS